MKKTDKPEASQGGALTRFVQQPPVNACPACGLPGLPYAAVWECDNRRCNVMIFRSRRAKRKPNVQSSDRP